MVSHLARVDEAATWLRTHLRAIPEVAVVLGSGLGPFAESLGQQTAYDYHAIPHWPPSRITGHAGRLIVGTAASRRVLALSGRVHAYEGHDANTVTFAVRVLGRLGVKTLVLTNAAGGINPRFTRGALMVIDDHINLTGSNPLVGPNEDRFGRRFRICPRSTRALRPSPTRPAEACRSSTASISRSLSG
jgi:purine-nucleoside phosphorylase